MAIQTERQLLASAAALAPEHLAELAAPERELLQGLPRLSAARVSELRQRILQGHDPLGHAFARIRTAAERRHLGAVYTPRVIVDAMLEWAARDDPPTRVVDAGVGSGRFLLSAGRHFPEAKLVGVDVDPVATLMTRANLAAAGFADRSQIRLADYRRLLLDPIDGRTLFIGNPPYVRHHLIPAEWKTWFATEAERLGLTASCLAGLHVYFFVATLLHARSGDRGCFITAAEWLDVNYGKLLRELFLGPLGGESIAVLEPTARPFPDAAVTAAITTFRVGSKPRSVRLRRIDHIEQIPPVGSGTAVRWERLRTETRWTHLLRSAPPLAPGYVELGELCRVHRGQVTGANRVWIEGPQSRGLPDSVLYPSVTKARELFALDGALTDAANLRRVIDIPVELDEIPREYRAAVDRFLAWARSLGADRSYVARHRRAWWAVGLRPPPPIIATYMARRPPAFVLNQARARYINIAHGIYPREPMLPEILARLVECLMEAGAVARGRIYAGGLMKFEPREMERIPVPRPELLAREIVP